MRDFDPVVVINCRDRVRALRKLIAWLEQAGHERIVLLDNASTYRPMVEYLADQQTRRPVIRCENLGSRALWTDHVIHLLRAWHEPRHPSLDVTREWFVYTDSDVVPTDDCPLDAVDALHAALQSTKGIGHYKAALGLRIVPGMRSEQWEHRLLNPQPGDQWEGYLGDVLTSEGAAMPVYDSLADTTFALYRPGSDFELRALRTGFPYIADHDCPSWTGAELDDEDHYYLAHAEGANTQNGVPIADRIIGSSWKDAANAAA